MKRTAEQSTESLANHLVNYLFDEYQGSLHVRRVATWIGFVLKGIERIAGGTLARNRTRQISFEYRNRRFKARYSHQVGGRGGLEIVEVLPGRGAPEGEVVVRIANLDEAEAIYDALGQRLDEFVDG
jgi:hypothetical protein